MNQARRLRHLITLSWFEDEGLAVGHRKSLYPRSVVTEIEIFGTSCEIRTNQLPTVYIGGGDYIKKTYTMKNVFLRYRITFFEKNASWFHLPIRRFPHPGKLVFMREIRNRSFIPTKSWVCPRQLQIMFGQSAKAYYIADTRGAVSTCTRCCVSGARFGQPHVFSEPRRTGPLQSYQKHEVA